MEKPISKQFTLAKVVTYPYYFNYLLGLLIGGPMFFIYAEVGFESLGLFGLVLTFFAVALTITSIIKSLSKAVSIYFDKEFMYITYDSKITEKYLKNDIAGVYSYNYEQIEKSFISIQFNLKNGQKIELTDINISEKIDKEKAVLLKKFLIVLKEELGFTLLKKNRVRSLQKLGADWFAKPTVDAEYNT